VILSKVNAGLTKSGDEFNYFVPANLFNGYKFWKILDNLAFNVICSKDSQNLRMSTVTA